MGVQITRLGAAWAPSRQMETSVPIGGSAGDYQELFASLAA
jgi:hypothetical protein